MNHPELKKSRGVRARLAAAILSILASFVSLASFPALGDSTSTIAPAPVAAPILSQGARFLPVLAEHGMVAAQEGKAAAIGVDVEF